MTTKTYRIALSGLLTSLMLILGYVERWIPITSGIPGVKLGLANSVLLYGIYILGIKQTFILMIVKVLLSSFMFGSVSAMLYSFAGGVLSMLFMIIIKQIRGVSVIGVSATGAIFHNLGQILASMIILHTTQLIFYLPVLLVAGVVTGVLTGMIANMVLSKVNLASMKANGS